MSDQRQPDVDELATLRTVLELIPQTVLIVDGRTGRIVDANPAACRALATARAQVVGRAWSSVSERLGELPLRPADSAGRWLIAVGHALAAENPPQVANSRDPLTGLANRDALWTRALVDGAGRRSRSVALLFIDLDGFKQVNDRHGHVAGDEFLRAVSRRLDRAVAESDLVGRWGGDEFILVLTVSPDRAEPVLRRVQDTITRMPIETTDARVPAELSIGAAAWGVDEPFDGVLRRADHALYEGKAAGGGRLVIDTELPADPPQVEEPPDQARAG